MAMMSSPELADAVGISQPSVTRFAMALGFSGFADLRRALADELLRAGADVDRAGPPTADPVVDPAASNVAALHRSLPSAEMLLTLGSDLHGAPTLGVFGLRVAEAPARWFHFLAQKVHADVRLVSDGVGHLVDTIGSFGSAHLHGTTIRPRKIATAIGPTFDREATLMHQAMMMGAK